MRRPDVIEALRVLAHSECELNCALLAVMDVIECEVPALAKPTLIERTLASGHGVFARWRYMSTGSVVLGFSENGEQDDTFVVNVSIHTESTDGPELAKALYESLGHSYGSVKQYEKNGTHHVIVRDVPLCDLQCPTSPVLKIFTKTFTWASSVRAR